MDDNSFSSIDRLVEFGMGMAIANQMISTMNTCIAGMRVPGVGNPIVSTKRLYYFVVNGNAQVGPCEESELADYVKIGSLRQDSLMWRQGLSGWVFARDLPEINKLFMLIKP